MDVVAPVRQVRAPEENRVFRGAVCVNRVRHGVHQTRVPSLTVAAVCARAQAERNATQRALPVSRYAHRRAVENNVDLMDAGEFAVPVLQTPRAALPRNVSRTHPAAADSNRAFPSAQVNSVAITGVEVRAAIVRSEARPA